MTADQLRSAYEQLCADLSAGNEHLSAVLVAETAITLTVTLMRQGLDNGPTELTETVESLARRIATLRQAGDLIEDYDGQWCSTTAGARLEFFHQVATRFLAWHRGSSDAVTVEWLITLLADPAPRSPLPAPSYGPDNPRFVWVVGAIREQFPDIPEHAGGLSGDVHLWDRQHGRTVALLTAGYAQAMALETTRQPGDAPFTALADWLNGLTPEELASENLPA